MRLLSNPSTDPHFNMAFDETVLEAFPSDEPVFYLWQNRPAVIIGQNQSAYAEVNLPYLQEHGIILARRVTGGGAVYHDLGNLNYSFAGGVRQMEELQPVQLISSALRSFGIPAEVSGRNDILVEGRKCSGYAKRLSGSRMMIHGTLMFNVDLAALSAALSVPGSKFATGGEVIDGYENYFSSSVPKNQFSSPVRRPQTSFHGSSVESVSSAGIASVRSRVCNLSEYLPGWSLEQFRAHLTEFMAASSLRAEALERLCAPSDSVRCTQSLQTACLSQSPATPAFGSDSPSFHGLSVESVSADFLSCVNALADSKFRSWDWIYGHSPATEFCTARKFPSCGTVELRFSIRRGLLADVHFAGDFLGNLPAEQLASELEGTRFDKDALRSRLDSLSVDRYFDGLCAADLVSLLC